MNAQQMRDIYAHASDAPRVIFTRHGGPLGPEYKVMVGDRCFFVGELTKRLLMSGTPLDELDLLEINPDEEERIDW